MKQALLYPSDKEMAHHGFQKDLAIASNYHFHQPEDSLDQTVSETCTSTTLLLQINCGSDTKAAGNVPNMVESTEVNDKDSNRPVAGRLDCSNQIHDDNDSKCLKINGKGQAKNLEAERKRRKKLNEGLYKLRTLVPIISKLDKAHILVDAIEYVKQLKKQVEELQEELEQDSHNDGTEEVADELGNYVPKNIPNPFVARSCHTEIDYEKVQQMEPQVDVTSVDRNKFVIRVFCEHKRDGFVRLLEVLSSLGLEVVNVNVTNCRMLVSNIKGDTNQMMADDLKNSLLELSRFPSGAPWPPPDYISNEPDNEDVTGYHYQHSLLGHHTKLYHFPN